MVCRPCHSRRCCYARLFVCALEQSRVLPQEPLQRPQVAHLRRLDHLLRRSLRHSNNSSRGAGQGKDNASAQPFPRLSHL